MRERTAIHVVREYLERMEHRDLEGAQCLLHDDAHIVFPGGFQARTTADIAAYGKRRYVSVGKTVHTEEAFAAGGGEERVILTGTLHGTNLKGREFAGVRFIDLFTVRDGRIARQAVWNDLAEAGVLES